MRRDALGDPAGCGDHAHPAPPRRLSPRNRPGGPLANAGRSNRPSRLSRPRPALESRRPQPADGGRCRRWRAPRHRVMGISGRCGRKYAAPPAASAPAPPAVRRSGAPLGCGCRQPRAEISARDEPQRRVFGAPEEGRTRCVRVAFANLRRLAPV
jgi:hypothetical protein